MLHCGVTQGTAQHFYALCANAPCCSGLHIVRPARNDPWRTRRARARPEVSERLVWAVRQTQCPGGRGREDVTHVWGNAWRQTGSCGDPLPQLRLIRMIPPPPRGVKKGALALMPSDAAHRWCARGLGSSKCKAPSRCSRAGRTLFGNPRQRERRGIPRPHER